MAVSKQSFLIVNTLDAGEMNRNEVTLTRVKSLWPDDWIGASLNRLGLSGASRH